MSDNHTYAQIARLIAETEKLRTERRVLIFMAGVKCVVAIAACLVAIPVAAFIASRLWTMPWLSL